MAKIGRQVLMMSISRRFLYMCPFMVLASLMLIGLADMSFAQPDQISNTNENRELMDPEPPEGMMFHQMDGLPMGVPIEILQSGRGFALKDNESHVLRLNVETLLPLDPTQIRTLLASNKSLDEIREEIRAREDETTYRGSLMLDRSIYPLGNIELSPSGNNSTAVRADLADPSLMSADSEIAIVGSISVIIATSEGGMVGKGELELNQTQYRGNYTVLLDMQPHTCGKEHARNGEMCR